MAIVDPSARASFALRRRERLLDEIADGAARTWNERWRSTLEAEGRAIEGGFPGTMREARAEVARFAARALVEQGAPALTPEELPRVTRLAYDEARRRWRGAAR